MNRPKLSTNIHIEEVGKKQGEPIFFVLDPDIPSWVFLNRDGVDILQLCNGQRTIAEVEGQLVASHPEVAPQVISGMMHAFLDNMERHQILGASPPEKKENPFHGIALEITQSCNLRCKHCYLSAGLEHENELTFDEIKQALNELKAVDGISVAIGGGEPLMRKDCLPIIEHAASIGLLISIGTNGTLVDKEMAQALARLPIKIQVSLDGATATTHDKIRGKGNFDLAVRGIDHLLEAGKGKDVLLAFTPMQPNVHEVPKIIDFALDRQISVIQFPPLTSSGRAKVRWEDIVLTPENKLWFWGYIHHRSQELKGQLDLLADCFSININRVGKPFQCTIGTQFRIDPSGNIYPCQCFHFGSEFCLGNIRENSLAEVVRGQRIQQIKQMSFSRPYQIAACKDCIWRNFCGSGCMGNAFERTGTILNTTGCAIRKQWIERLFEVKLEEAIAVV